MQRVAHAQRYGGVGAMRRGTDRSADPGRAFMRRAVGLPMLAAPAAPGTSLPTCMHSHNLCYSLSFTASSQCTPQE